MLCLVGVCLFGGAVLLLKQVFPNVAGDLVVSRCEVETRGAVDSPARDRPCRGGSDLEEHLLRVEACVRSGVPEEDAGRGHVAGRIHLNTATEAELCLLPGIGPKRAQAILRYRGEHGRFRDIRDLEKVKGIGPVTLERIARFVEVGDAGEQADRAQ